MISRDQVIYSNYFTMDLFLLIALHFAWISVVDCKPTEIRTNETANSNNLTTMTPLPTTTKEIERSSFVRERTTKFSLSSTASSTQKINKFISKTENSSPFFWTSDAKKLSIMVIAQSAVLLILVLVILTLCSTYRRMKVKMRRMKENQNKDNKTNLGESSVQGTDSSPVEVLPSIEEPERHESVKYEVPYAHHQTMAVQIRKLVDKGSSTANETPVNENHVNNQETPFESPVSLEDDDYVKPRTIESIIESIPNHKDTKSLPFEDEQANNNQEYKIPRNATKRAGLMRKDSSFDDGRKSTLKDRDDYIILMNTAGCTIRRSHSLNNLLGDNGVVEGERNQYDVPRNARSADTLSGRTTKSKIKLFQEKLKSDKTKQLAPAANRKFTQKDSAKKKW